MKSKFPISLCIGTSLTLTFMQPFFAASSDVTTAAPVSSFVPMLDGSGEFAEPKGKDEYLRQRVAGVGSDDGFSVGGLIRQMLSDHSYRRREPDCEEQAWTTAKVVAYIDQFGLYDLAPLAARKAQELANKPLASLRQQGVLELIDAAYYYSATGRRAEADAIFANLTTKVWPMAPRDLSEIVLYDRAKYLTDQGRDQEAKALHDAFFALTLDPQCPPNAHYTGDNGTYWLPRRTDWQPAFQAFQAINSKNYSKATLLIAALLDEEQKKKKHQANEISRLINLAITYNQRGRKADAESLFESLLPFTTDENMLNVRLYLQAELFLMQAESTPKSRDCWNYLEQTSRKIDLTVQTQKQPPINELPVKADRFTMLMDRLALAYEADDQSAKALRLLKTTIAYYPSATHRKADILAHLALFSAEVGDYAAAKEYIVQSLRYPEDIHNLYILALGRIFDVCSYKGNAPAAEDIAKMFIDARIERVRRMPATAQDWDNGQTTAERMDWRAFALRDELSLIRFRLGELFDRQGRFVEAETNLKQVRVEEPLVDDTRAQYFVALGEALEGQKKYDEAIALYLKCDYRQESYEPVSIRLANVLVKGTKLDDQLRQKALHVVRQEDYLRRGEPTSGRIKQLLDCAIAQGWSAGEIYQLRSSLVYCYRQEGRTDMAKADADFIADTNALPTKLADLLQTARVMVRRREYAKAIDIIMGVLNEDRLTELQPYFDSERSMENSFQYADLSCIGQNEGAEKIMDRCIHLVQSDLALDHKNGNNYGERSALLDLYLRLRRYKEAQDLGAKLVADFVRNSTLLDQDAAPGSSFNQELYSLMTIGDKYLKCGRTDDAKSFAFAVLAYERKWLGPKNAQLSSVYWLLAQIAKAQKDDKQEENYLQKSLAIMRWNSSGQMGGPSYELTAYEALLQRQGRKAEAARLLVHKELPEELPPELFPQEYFGRLAKNVAQMHVRENELRIKYLLKRSIEELGPGNVRSVQILTDLAVLYWRAHRYDEADKLLLQKRQIIADLDGRCGYRKATCLAEQACLEISRGDKSRAKELLAAAEKSNDGRLLSNPPATLLASFAAVKYKLGETADAIGLARKAVEKQSKAALPVKTDSIFAPCIIILAGTDLSQKANSLIPHARCTPIDPPDAGFFSI